jgi:hypothetical protein
LTIKDFLLHFLQTIHRQIKKRKRKRERERERERARERERGWEVKGDWRKLHLEFVDLFSWVISGW